MFTDGLKNPYAFQEFEDGVYAIVGPLSTFTADPDFVAELTDLCRRYNLQHGHLSKEKYRKLARS